MKQSEQSDVRPQLGRRSFLTAVGAAGVVGLAGCLDNTPDLPPVESLPRPAQGSTDAPVTVAVFEDYMCPACAAYVTQVVPPLKENYVDTGDVLFEFYDFPIPVSNTLSYAAAEAARSVQNNIGMDAFWEYNRLVYVNQSSINRPSALYDLAERLGADRETLINEVRANVYRGIVDDDRQRGIELGVSGTPYVFVNGEYLSNPSYNRLSNKIEAELTQ
jgi:protein-disulfide isomerase